MKRFRPNIFKNSILILFILSLILIINNLIDNKVKEINKNSSRIEIGGKFELENQDGIKVVSNEINKIKLIYFGYTYCPDVCPLDLLEISSFFDENKQFLKHIQPIFISLDPQRDSPGTIKNYLENFGSFIIGLTGDIKDIDVVLKKYKIYRRVQQNIEQPDNYTIDHTSLYYLMDKEDNYIAHFNRENFRNSFKKFLLEKKFL
tara:strand:+ start:376 stop:987 length:612 start_codon:yes stop_codon:yes gene_type:complete